MNAPAPSEKATQSTCGFVGRFFFVLACVLIGGAILRSAIATRLDDFTYDEAYHIAAGASYVQRADFRINPEHPPLVKLWVGAAVTAGGFRLSPFRAFNDKGDERKFAEEQVYLNSDADQVQRRARIAMWCLNGLLLLALAIALRRAFSPAVALGTIVFLAIDPTVAAHLPVVMTDLPVGLLSLTAVIVGAIAYRTWAWRDMAWCSLVLGLALGTKHSAPIFAIFLGLTGSALAVIKGRAANERLFRLGKVAVLLVGALIVLWGLYFFHLHESPGPMETFNRPLQDKITDLKSAPHRFVLRELVSSRLLPRAYVWGMADVVRAGLEGRADSQLAFGHLFYNKAPWYFFPGVILVKVPIGLSLMSIACVVLVARGYAPRDWTQPILIVFGAAFCFFLVLSRGATYAGVRHAMPLLVTWALLAGLVAHVVWHSQSRLLKVFYVAALLFAAASAIPVPRPWEYFNELTGGPSRAYLYFDDEGVDLGQRCKEAIHYYREVVQPTGEIPYMNVQCGDVESRKAGLDWVGQDAKRDAERMASPVWSGTVITDAKLISPELWWDAPALRAAQPIARRGNLMIFRGAFSVPGKQAVDRYLDARDKTSANPPDFSAAASLLEQSLQADSRPFFVHIALGNVRLHMGSRVAALQAYRAALQRVPNDPEMRNAIEQQIGKVSSGENLGRIPELRDPGVE